MRLVMFQPDIPQNAGAVLRLAACFGVAADVIEPLGFIWDEPRMRRAGMDYIDAVEIVRHASWQRYQSARPAGRLVLLTTAGKVSYAEFGFRPDDRLMVGRETAGVPPEVHEAADARILVPMRRPLRSLNVAMAAAIVLAEALRQTGGLPAAGGEVDAPKAME